MKVNLKDQVALVTGAAQGIGKSIAEALAANGARVVLTDIDYPKTVKAAETLPACVAKELNVTDDRQIDEVIEWTVEEFGRLDLIVNNAGVNTLDHRVTIDEFPRAEWDRLLDVDLNGLFSVCKAAARVMRSQGYGRIINIASVAGLVPLRLQCAFVAAKAGVISLTKSMAIELGQFGILVNAIAPGSIITRGTRDLFYGEDGQFRDSTQQLLSHIPLGRPGTTEEIAHAALFLAAPESSYINGHILTVDGGWTAGYTRDF
jgi:NAD(P)-dependent dehydrogenase (short-subunit alcohol dehydrogenase family)